MANEWAGKFNEFVDYLKAGLPLAKGGIQDFVDAKLADYPDGSIKEMVADKGIDLGGFFADQFLPALAEALDKAKLPEA